MAANQTVSPKINQEPAAVIRQPLSRIRAFFNNGMTVLALGLTLIASFPLISLFIEVLRRGGSTLSWEVFTNLPAPPGVTDVPNGFANAILGTFRIVVMASLMSIPLGVISGIFLAEYGKQNLKLANLVRFVAKVLTSVPSIIVGTFAYTVIVFQTKNYSAFASAVALGILMLPVVALTSEEALKLVPQPIRLASAALGGTKFQGTFRVVLPSAISGIVTGVLLAISRAAGETAPILLTSMFTDSWPEPLPQGIFTGPTPTLSVLIYSYATSPVLEQNQTAWVAALVLLLLVLILNISSRFLVRKKV